MRLGGIDLPHDQSAVGHSDADVLLHAVIDALLGAAGLPDIGQMFPDTEPANRGRDSREMLAIAWKKVADHGFRIVNLDSIVFVQHCKISPHKQSLRSSLADLLGVPIERVNVKAKTGEEVGPIGRGEAIAAQCVVLLEPDSPA